MIKRSPQEIADIFHGYVFRNCGSASWIIAPDKPKIVKGEWTWNHDSTLWFLLPVSIIKADPDHDWTVLYKPHLDNKNEDCYSEQADSDNKKGLIEVFKSIQARKESAPHQSEVYTNKEYCVVAASDFESLKKRVQNMMNSEWKPQGGIVVEHLKEVFFYQAMVRGI